MDFAPRTSQRVALPWFALLEAPYGMQNAVVATLPLYVLHAEGVSLETAAAISALCLTPATFYFLYAPVVDFFVRRRTWYLLALVCVAVLTGGTILLPARRHLHWLTALLFSGVVMTMLLGAATGGLANALDDDPKKNVGAWLQLGNLGASSLMMALLVYASSRCSRPVLALFSSVAILLPGLAVLAVREAPHAEPDAAFRGTVGETWRELKSVFFRLNAVPAILLLLSPIGNNAMPSVLMGLTSTYHATEAQLTFANGWGGGLVTALGALCALLVPKAWNRMLPYAIAGVVYGAASVGIGFLPLTPAMFVVALLLTNFVSGVAFGLYTGVVLQTAGSGGPRHSTRYTILNSVGNLSVVYMLALLGAVAGRRGIRPAGLADGAMNLAAALLFFAWWAWARVWKPALLQTVTVPESVIAA